VAAGGSPFCRCCADDFLSADILRNTRLSQHAAHGGGMRRQRRRSCAHAAQ
jgi:hypothetical protein